MIANPVQFDPQWLHHNGGGRALRADYCSPHTRRATLCVFVPARDWKGRPA